MLIRTRPVFEADGAAGAAGGAPPAAGAAPPPAAGAAPPPARPDWLPANLELDKQFLGETPSAADTISRLHNAYKGSREAISKFGAVPDKPDGYKIEGSPEVVKLFGNPDDKGMEILRTAAQQAGITDRQLPALLTTFAKGFIEAGLLPTPIDPKAEAQKLVGSDFRGNEAELIAEGKRRETAAEAWVDGLVTNGTFTAEEGAYLKSMSGTATGIMTLEKLQRKSSGGPGIQTGGQGGATGLTDDQVRARMRDPRYFASRPEYDQAFAEETQRLAKERFK